ncbi:MAG: DUF4239 domain-containing protein [Anaerolineales bacterium]|nr:DUF4239 domain-containing protein [Anaerolineales bacterium]
MTDSIWFVGLMIVGALVALALGGLYLFQRVAERHWKLSEDSNNDIIFFASAIGVFYSLIVGLIAVGVWTNYMEVETIVSEEAASIGALYRDVAGIEQPTAQLLQDELREYTAFIINEAWPAQEQGITIVEGTEMLNEFQATLYSYQPATLAQQAIFAEALQEYNNVIHFRRRRIEAIDGGLPTVMWTIVLVGAFLTITVTYLLKNRTTDTLSLNGIPCAVYRGPSSS